MAQPFPGGLQWKPFPVFGKGRGFERNVHRGCPGRVFHHVPRQRGLHDGRSFGCVPNLAYRIRRHRSADT